MLNMGFQRSRYLDNILNANFYTNIEKDSIEVTHSNRVSELCKYLGMAMELTYDDIYMLEISGLFHDIGKIAIQEQTLNKPGPLSEDEWDEIMQHPEIGYKILCTSIEMSEIAKYVLYHHERYDGLGYPKGLKGEEIPLLSRIISVVDSYDAMTNQRVYRETLNKDMAVMELLRNKGKQFDPDIVDIFIEKVLVQNIG
ncbi:MAG: HD-GYP domain-containing protein [Bacillota bacterium]